MKASKRRTKAAALPAWTEFEPGEVPGYPDAEIWVNSRYQVWIERDVETPEGWPPVVWLSIKNRVFPKHRHDWREFQRIKNQLVGPECDAIEVYPRESMLVDTADQFHLWVFPTEATFPIQLPEAWAGRRVSEGETGPKGSQRPFEDPPKDLQKFRR